MEFFDSSFFWKPGWNPSLLGPLIAFLALVVQKLWPENNKIIN